MVEDLKCPVLPIFFLLPGRDCSTGPSHVIPLLLSVLPGIDPNDARKAMVTFQFMSTFCTLVPLVDSSDAFQHHQDLTEEERVICGQTAQVRRYLTCF